MQLLAQAQAVARAFKEHNKFLVTAESCTGGWIAKLMTDVVGSSGWFERGFVTYTNQSKQEILAVPAEVIHEQGAVSEATVRSMAAGALQHSHADYSVAVSGVAGPGGGTTYKPVGTVWIAWGQRTDKSTGFDVRSEHCLFEGDRDEIRRQAVSHALEGVLKAINEPAAGQATN
jgi:nicotinamide-nucleotide amidase